MKETTNMTPQRQYYMNIIIAILSFGGGIMIPYLWKQQARDDPRMFTEDDDDFTTTMRLLPLYQYSSKAHYDKHYKKRRKRTNTIDQDAPQYPCTKERLSEFLHDDENTWVPGYHVLCFTRLDNTEHHDTNPSQFHLTIYRNGRRMSDQNNDPTEKIETTRDTATTTAAATTTTILVVPHQMTWSRFQSDIIAPEILLRRDPKKSSNGHQKTPNQQQQPYALFTVDGQRVLQETRSPNDEKSENERDPWMVSVMAQHLGMVLLYEGGQFVWPGIRIGYERRDVPLWYQPNPTPTQLLPPPPPTNVTLVTLSLSPLVLAVHGFLTIEECQHIQQRATPHLAYSDVVLMDHDAGRPASDFRTSSTTFLDATHDPTLTALEYRTAALVRIPRHHQEPVQVLRYERTEKYQAHHDYFDPKFYGNDPGTLKLIQHGKRNRLVTVFWYLSTVPEGGETIFPRAFGQRERSTQDCETGLKVRPEMGKVILFYNMNMQGTIDPQSLHGACPVKQGIKWAANKWIWNEPMSYVPL